MANQSLKHQCINSNKIPQLNIPTRLTFCRDKIAFIEAYLDLTAMLCEFKGVQL